MGGEKEIDACMGKTVSHWDKMNQRFIMKDYIALWLDVSKTPQLELTHKYYPLVEKALENDRGRVQFSPVKRKTVKIPWALKGL